MTIIAKIGGKMNRRITITDTEIIDRYHHSFKVTEDRYPIAGAQAEVADTISGWRNQFHPILGNHQVRGRPADRLHVYDQGFIGRIEVARMTRFAASVNQVAAFWEGEPMSDGDGHFDS